MDQEVLVSEKLEGGRKLIDYLTSGQEPILEVKVAFWMMPSDEEKWFLYIASSTVGKTVNPGRAYHTVNNILRSAPEWGIDFFDVVIVGDANAMAIEALSLHGYSNSQGIKPQYIPFRGSKLGGYPINGAYIYLPRTLATVAA